MAFVMPPLSSQALVNNYVDKRGFSLALLSLEALAIIRILCEQKPHCLSGPGMDAGLHAGVGRWGEEVLGLSTETSSPLYIKNSLKERVREGFICSVQCLRLLFEESFPRYPSPEK